MATKFLEPGGDATFNTGTIASGRGFWTNAGGASTTATDFVHGSHQKSLKVGVGGVNYTLSTAFNTVSDTGARISFYLYLVALPTADAYIVSAYTGAPNNNGYISIFISSAGVLKLFEHSTQIGSNGSTLSTGIWYRISLAYTITNSTTNRFEVFLNGVSDISVTNATLAVADATSRVRWANQSGDATLDYRVSDIYIDDSNSLTDTGNIWVTAKRPNANGTTNGFTTQIGTGGSGYGTGHSPQVNERPVDLTNGWSMIGAGSAVTEEYNIESKSTGDIDISTATIVDYLGWYSASSLANETIQLILNGTNTAQAITSSNTVYTKVAGSSTYPAGTGADVGITTDTTLTTVSLYECGVVVAYIPSTVVVNVPYTNPNLKALNLLGVGI